MTAKNATGVTGATGFGVLHVSGTEQQRAVAAAEALTFSLLRVCAVLEGRDLPRQERDINGPGPFCIINMRDREYVTKDSVLQEATGVLARPKFAEEFKLCVRCVRGASLEQQCWVVLD